MYLSYVTLTTVGFGDLTPYTNLARSVVVLEALIGQIFLVTLVARLVALYSRDHGTPANLRIVRKGRRSAGVETERRPPNRGAARVGGQVHPRRGRPGAGPLDRLRRRSESPGQRARRRRSSPRVGPGASLPGERRDRGARRA